MKEAVNKVKNKAKELTDSVVDGFGRGVDTITGRAVIEQVTKFAQEMEAVNTAIVTRIYELLDQNQKLREEIKNTQARHQRTRNLAILSLTLNVFVFLRLSTSS